MAATRLWLVGLVLGVALALHPEDDFAFESSDGEPELLSPISHPHPTSAPVQRLWGVPDCVTSVGKLFRLSIPTDAFSGNLDHYEARGQGGGPLPSWLTFDKTTGIFEGVPGAKDVGEHYITIRALGQHPQDSAKDVFSIEVHENVGTETSLLTAASPIVKQISKAKCDAGEDPTILTILMDVKYEHMKPKQRVLAIKNLSGFLALHQSVFTLQPYNSQDDLLSDAVVLAGPGNMKKKSMKQSTAVRWQVGCEGRLWKQHASLAHQLRQQARDGTLSEVLQQPVIGWHVKTETSASHRERRETGSGDFVDDDDPAYDYSEGEDEDSESIPDTRIVPTMSSPVFPEATATHAHRHHHGETVEQLEPGSDVNTIPGLLQPSVTYRMPTSPVVYGTILPTPVLVPVRPTHLPASEIVVEPSRVYKEYAEVTPSATPVFITEVESSITTEMPTSQVTEPLPTSSSSSSGSSSSSSSSTTGTTGAASSSSSTSSTTEGTSTTEEDTTSSTPLVITERSSTARPTDEVVEYDIKNIKPTIEQRLPKLPITAGKAFRYQIPEDAFSDLEDGNTRNLRLIFKMQDGTAVPSSSWVQFDPEKQEVYALPLEEQVSKWEYVLEAMDKEGKSVSDNLAIQVQHHKGRRTVNHEFSIFLRVDKMDFPSDVDWQLQILDSLAELYGDADPNLITVRAINMSNDPIIFTWTNDSLPRSHCPRDAIEKLFKVLVANDKGEPSSALSKVLSPNMDVRKVTRRDLGPCIKPPSAIPSPVNPTENFAPVLRNQVDHINATVGELLSFRVPEDSFYDPEDGHARNLKLSLLTIDRSPIHPTNWLQFEVKNQEFYGIPMPGDEGRREYQLVCEDKGGLTAHDGLVVVVHPAAKVHYNVEFSMTLGISYDQFRSSASLKRKFVEKLCELFDTKNTSAVVLRDIREGSTIVTWANRSLPTDICPESEIGALRRVLVNDDGQVSGRVNMVMVEFDVQKVDLTPMGICQGELTRLHTTEAAAPPNQGTQPVQQSDDYLVTYVVPAVIIVAMLLLAGIVACVLYRRRRTGKMSVGDEDERQTFRNKGIPVIFQDELEEKPDPGNKSPVIMKEEKPPLPPPEYQRGEMEHATPPPTAAHPLLGDSTASEDPPYQPPPPFTSSRDSGRQNRPKPTPTYRKPPPYVPP
ncbi:dystroglycan 1 [Anabrus simplex]|uniref:dystroglycan 1 n=1 Tax=Anabrus simplex TaxID=316456 RepID=UPI0034DD2546